MSRRRRINQVHDPVMSLKTAATRVNRLVYLLVANRPINYGGKYSRIIYIGTTGKGVRRIASSASGRIEDAIDEIHGLKRIDVFVVWARSRKGRYTHNGVKFWQILERALLMCFCKEYDKPPKLNRTGHRMKPNSEFDVFSEAGILRVIRRYT